MDSSDVIGSSLNSRIGFNVKGVVLRNALFASFLRGEVSLSKQEAFVMNLDSDVYRLVIYDYFSISGKTASYRLSDFLRITEKDRTAFDSMKIGDMKIVLLKGHHIIENLEELIKRLESSQPPDTNSPIGSLMLFVGETVANYEELPAHFSKLEGLYSDRFFIPPGKRVLRCSDSRRESSSFSSDEERAQFINGLVEEYSARLSIDIQTSHRSHKLPALVSLDRSLLDSRLSENDVRICAFRLYDEIIRNLTKLGISLANPEKEKLQDADLILKSSYYIELHELFYSLARRCANFRSFSRDSIIEDILGYIDNFYSENITLEKLAPLFGYNSSYLGKIFTKKLGMKLSSYLDKVRIEKAKEMLRSRDLQVYKIAELVGYKNVDYFHVKFKKSTGVSPAEYRKNY